jgi:hypothetical protein
MVAFQHRAALGDLLEEGGFDGGIIPADEDEGEQVETDLLGVHRRMEAGNDLVADEALDAIIDGGGG